MSTSTKGPSGETTEAAGDSGALKEMLSDFISEAFIPKSVVRRVEESLQYRPNPEVMAQAVASAQAKVRRIIGQIDNLSSRAFLLRIPGSDFLEFLLLSEYIVHNAVSGERGALRYLKNTREPASRTLTICLNALGFRTPQDLKPYEKLVREKVNGGERLWLRLVASLKPRSVEN